MQKIVSKEELNKLLQLPKEVDVVGSVEHDHCTEYSICFPEPSERVCPRCGCTDCVKKDERQQTVRHVPVKGKGTLVSFKRRRYRCKQCHGSFQESVYWLYEGARITIPLYIAICKALQSPRPLTEIAFELGVRESVIRSVIEAVPFGPMPYLPQTLCIDEFAGHTGVWDSGNEKWNTHRFHCILADGDSRVVLDILPEPNADYLIHYFNTFFPLQERQRVQYFCCDFRKGFRKVARTCFPNAHICLDKFHVVQIQTRRINKLYNRVLKDLLAKQKSEKARNKTRKLFYRAFYLLSSRRSISNGYWFSDPEKKQERLNNILAFSEELTEAYQALQEFYNIEHSDAYAYQRYALGEWISSYSLSIYEDMRGIASLYRYNKQYILNAFKYDKTNAVCEGLNTNINLLKKNGYGAHKFKNFRKRILFAYGHIRFVKETYTIFGERNSTARKEATS